MNENHVLEVVIFKTKTDANIPQLRTQIQEALGRFTGFIEFCGYSPLGTDYYIDLVKWDSHENAKTAAAAFEAGDQSLAPYMATIEEVLFMGHFQSDVLFR
jgi:hypothetical protein